MASFHYSSYLKAGVSLLPYSYSWRNVYPPINRNRAVNTKVAPRQLEAWMAAAISGRAKVGAKESRQNGGPGSTTTTDGRGAAYEYSSQPPPPLPVTNNINHSIFKPFSQSIYAPPHTLPHRDSNRTNFSTKTRTTGNNSIQPSRSQRCAKPREVFAISVARGLDGSSVLRPSKSGRQRITPKRWSRLDDDNRWKRCRL